MRQVNKIKDNMDPLTAATTALALGKAGVDAWQKNTLSENKKIKDAALENRDVEKDDSMAVGIDFSKQGTGPTGYSRSMNSGTSSIESSVDTNYNQKFNDLSMGTMDATSVPENDTLNDDNITTI